MTRQDQIEALVEWLRDYDPALLHNEAEVESKFVEPLFRLLGYPEGCRRPKFPLAAYNPNRQGRKPEPDQVYFAGEDPGQHTADATLVIVEAKAPGDDDLDEAVRQALFYAFHLKPPFVAATNGRRLRVLKWSAGGRDEVIFNDYVGKLAGRAEAARIVALLNFEIVKHLKERMKDSLTHGQYVQVAQAMRHYPELPEILDAGDFAPSSFSLGDTLEVVRPKVKITCRLPVAFETGWATVEFSNVFRSGLITHLTHRDILKDFMPGLRTAPEQGARPYLRHAGGGFRAELGQVTTTLTRSEADDLCACVDEACQAYKDRLIGAEDTLRTWEYERVRVYDMQGFRILSVRPWLWSLMKRFSSEFDNFKRESAWHVFERHSIAIRIARDVTDNANLYPRYDYDPMSPALPSYVDVIYAVPPYSFEAAPGRDRSLWRQAVGARGIWTAAYARDWVLKEFIPEVLRHFRREYRHHRSEQDVMIKNGRDQVSRPAPDAIGELAQLYDYLHEVQAWLAIQPGNVRLPPRGSGVACDPTGERRRGAPPPLLRSFHGSSARHRPRGRGRQL